MGCHNPTITLNILQHPLLLTPDHAVYSCQLVALTNYFLHDQVRFQIGNQRFYCLKFCTTSVNYIWEDFSAKYLNKSE